MGVGIPSVLFHLFPPGTKGLAHSLLLYPLGGSKVVDLTQGCVDSSDGVSLGLLDPMVGWLVVSPPIGVTWCP